MKPINALILAGLVSVFSACEVLDQLPQAEVAEAIAVTNKKGAFRLLKFLSVRMVGRDGFEPTYTM